MDTTLTFDALGIAPGLNRILADQRVVDPTPIQREAIPLLLEGRDVIGQARTGSGKTLAFVLPLVSRLDSKERAVQAIVLAPTRELAIQIGDVLTPFARERGLTWALIYGGRSLFHDVRALRMSPNIVVATPGRALDHIRQGTLRLDRVRVLVLDEADQMLDEGMGLDVERIIAVTPKTRQTVLFSATVPAWVNGAAAQHMRTPETVRVDAEGEALPEVTQVVYDVGRDAKLPALRALLDHRPPGSLIVFGRTKHGVKKLASHLASLGYPAAALQGNMSQNARERVMKDLRSGAVPILVATNVAARGIDVQDVAQVINYELPESAGLFTHRVGRTGRMGRAGEAITLFNADDQSKLREIERHLGRRLRRLAWPAGFTPNHPRRSPPSAPFVAPGPPEVPSANGGADGRVRRARHQAHRQRLGPDDRGRRVANAPRSDRGDRRGQQRIRRPA